MVECEKRYKEEKNLDKYFKCHVFNNYYCVPKFIKKIVLCIKIVTKETEFVFMWSMMMI